MFQGLMQQLPYAIAALVPALTFHEWGHAMMAKQFGDDTPRQQGRLTLNPLAHLDVLGTIAIFLIGFGWAKPVPIDPRNFKSSWGPFFVAMAGPGMNIVLAIVFAIFMRTNLAGLMPPDFSEFAHDVFLFSLQMNLALCFFNLIPIGPLDGSHIVSRLLPKMTSLRFDQWNAQYGSMVMLGVIFLNMLTPLKILSYAILVPTHLMMNLLLGGQVA